MVPPACSSKQTLENVAFLSSLRPEIWLFPVNFGKSRNFQTDNNTFVFK